MKHEIRDVKTGATSIIEEADRPQTPMKERPKAVDLAALESRVVAVEEKAALAAKV